MWLFLALLLVAGCSLFVFMRQASFGRLPQGERLERIKRSPHYRDGRFHNLVPTPQLSTDKSMLRSLFEFAFRRQDGLRPRKPLPFVKTDLHCLNREEDLLVWMGHSSLYLQAAGKRILVDPVLFEAAPLPFFNRPFKGTNFYKPEDIPDIDCLLITHDHWDHLDYKAVRALKERVRLFICGLGVGEHLERWGVKRERIIELDWDESRQPFPGMMVHCLPARHFPGRSFNRDRTLWVSFMLELGGKRIYFGGDSGYGGHFAEIGERFGGVDLAILENGQYDEDWRFIHIMPEELPKAALELRARNLFTVHNSKYALARHDWKAPLENISKAAEKVGIRLLTPMAGEVVRLNEQEQTFERWWEAY